MASIAAEKMVADRAQEVLGYLGAAERQVMQTYIDQRVRASVDRYERSTILIATVTATVIVCAFAWLIISEERAVYAENKALHTRLAALESVCLVKPEEPHAP